MKKLFTLIVALTAFSLQAQTFQLYYNSQTLNNNDTIYRNVQIDETDEFFIEYANISENDIYLQVERTDMTSIPDEENTFCVGGTCYIGTQSRPFFVTAGSHITHSDSSVFHANYSTPSNGQALKKFCFSDTENNESISFFVSYYTGTGIAQADAARLQVQAHPNPAHNRVTVRYTATDKGNCHIVIKDLVGREVFRCPAGNEGAVSVDLSDIMAGIYLYGIELDGKTSATKKLVVK